MVQNGLSPSNVYSWPVSTSHTCISLGFDDAENVYCDYCNICSGMQKPHACVAMYVLLQIQASS